MTIEKEKKLYWIKLLKGRSNDAKSSMFIDTAVEYSESISDEIVSTIIFEIKLEILGQVSDEDSSQLKNQMLKHVIKHMLTQTRNGAVHEISNDIRDRLLGTTDEKIRTHDDILKDISLARKKASEKLVDPNLLNKYPNLKF